MLAIVRENQLKRKTLDITGMPYVPGVVTGRLHRGVDITDSAHIILVSQQEVSRLNGRPAGIIVVEAAPFSHTMIGVLGMGVPTVLIDSDQAEILDEGAELLVDGNSGRITDDAGIEVPVAKRPPVPEAGRPVSMADGEQVQLCASVRTPAAASQAVAMGARAIGLVRSEFLIPEAGGIPDQAFYTSTFHSLCESALPLPVTFRLLDIASDKIPGWVDQGQSQLKSLGLQGVRLYGDGQLRHIIDGQLSALKEIGQEFDIRVVIPFLVRLEEFEYWRGQARRLLPDSVPVGAMAETLAAVLDADALLAQADFVAIGCNDLMQGLYAADRDLGSLRHYMDPYAPVLFRLFRQVAEHSGMGLGRVRLCGVLPQIQGILPILMGLGYRSFSVDAPFIPYLAEIIAEHAQTDCRDLAGEVCGAQTTQEVLEILRLPTDRHPPFRV